MFTDRVKIHFIAGKGGNGCVAWRREKYLPKGGPTGGNGGNGAPIILEADSQRFCLEWFHRRRKIKAENGVQGGANLRNGRYGKKLILKVPLGTLVKDVDSGEILYDFTKDGERFEICKGGRGGRGNHSFKSSTNRAPNQSTPGKPGEEKTVELELKLIADVGLVGFPNAGKSTLMSAICNISLKVGAYPFTTLRPNIGFIRKKDHSRVVLADIPGIIEDAHQNRGLGLEFLRHIERTKLLLFVLDSSGIDGRTPSDDFRVLRNEIEAYNPDLLHRPYAIVLNKVDTEESKEHLEEFYSKYSSACKNIFELSALSKEGIPPLLNYLESFDFLEE